MKYSGEYPTVKALRLRDVWAIMDKLRFKGSWNELEGKFKQHFGNLTDDALVYSERKMNSLAGSKKGWAKGKTNCGR